MTQMEVNVRSRHLRRQLNSTHMALWKKTFHEFFAMQSKLRAEMVFRNSFQNIMLLPGLVLVSVTYVNDLLGNFGEL